MKRYEELAVLRFYVVLENPDVVVEIQDNPDVMEEIALNLYRVARKRGQVQGDDHLPPGRGPILWKRLPVSWCA
jgi:hypothetical protein